MVNNPLDQYIALMEVFTSGKMPANEFETKYLDFFKKDNERKTEQVFLVLHEVFLDVDAYCGDPELREEEDLDEEQLKESCRQALSKLKAIEQG